MKLKYIMASFLIGSCTFISSCKDDFADINTNPTIVSKPDPRYLFTQALANFDGHDYFAWYYDYNNMLRWSQTVASTGGNENLMTTMSNSGKMGSQVYNVMNQVNELTYIVNTTLEGEEQAKYTYLKALCQPLMIYLAMWDTESGRSRALLPSSPLRTVREGFPSYGSSFSKSLFVCRDRLILLLVSIVFTG